MEDEDVAVALIARLATLDPDQAVAQAVRDLQLGVYVLSYLRGSTPREMLERVAPGLIDGEDWRRFTVSVANMVERVTHHVQGE